MSTGDRNGAAPTPVTNRRYLQNGLPTLYREHPFTMQFVSAFEGVLDPAVALLDALPAHFTPALAPLDILELTGGWLGVKTGEQQPPEHLRDLVSHATQLGRLRGTRAGLELTLELSFPDLPLRVEDAGGVTWSADGTVPGAAAPSFVVYCEQPIPRDQAAELARVIEDVKPAHVPYELRIDESPTDAGSAE